MDFIRQTFKNWPKMHFLWCSSMFRIFSWCHSCPVILWRDIHFILATDVPPWRATLHMDTRWNWSLVWSLQVIHIAINCQLILSSFGCSIYEWNNILVGSARKICTCTNRLSAGFNKVSPKFSRSHVLVHVTTLHVRCISFKYIIILYLHFPLLCI